MSADEQPELLLDATKVSDVLQVMSEDLVNSAAEKGTSFLTNDGERIKEPASAIMAETTCKLEADGAYYLSYGGHRLELSIVIQLRNKWATANSPTGTAVLKEWKSDSRRNPSPSSLVPTPTGVSIRPYNEPRGYKSWVKNTRHDHLEWEELLCVVFTIKLIPTPDPVPNRFDAHFKGADEGKSGEYTISGHPVARDKMFDMFQLMNDKFSTYSQSTLKLSPAEPHHPPDSKMYLQAARQVFVPNNLPLDEGRGSEYVDPFGILKVIGPRAAVRNNRIPEVTVRNHIDNIEQAMSFHQIHRLSTSETLFSVTVVPRASQKPCKDADANSKKCLGWGFRLVNVRVLGKREPVQPKSPKKSVKIRKLHDTDFELEEEVGSNKAQKT
ncbi:hypothetical protein V5O48_015908 [Marasmius crinis-equi]|uniref:Uncharacterized protein n=1 Tax=Marasmius crinis-equi TaxID=585013 RepID=A0ABR3ETH9_9AGAR